MLPEDAWLTGHDRGRADDRVDRRRALRSARGRAGDDQGVTIQGATYSHLSVARVLARLATIPSLDDVRLTATAHGRADDHGVGRQVDVEDEEAEGRRDVHDRREHLRERIVKARFAALSPRALVAIAAAAVLVWALALWFLLVAPKRSDAAGLSGDVVAAELQLADMRLQARQAADVVERREGRRRAQAREGDAVERRPGGPRSRARPARPVLGRHAPVDHADRGGARSRRRHHDSRRRHGNGVVSPDHAVPPAHTGARARPRRRCARDRSSPDDAGRRARRVEHPEVPVPRRDDHPERLRLRRARSFRRRRLRPRPTRRARRRARPQPGARRDPRGSVLRASASRRSSSSSAGSSWWSCSRSSAAEAARRRRRHTVLGRND